MSQEHDLGIPNIFPKPVCLTVRYLISFFSQGIKWLEPGYHIIAVKYTLPETDSITGKYSV